MASVTGPEEATIALAGGADIIDLKDPAQGALGAVAPAILSATLREIAGRRPVSAVAGDLPMQPAAVIDAVAARGQADFVKIGLFPAPRAERLAVIDALASLAETVRLVAVFFADGDPDFGLLEALAAAGFYGAMIDTMGKGGDGLLSTLSLPALSRFVSRARAFNLVTGLAGSLEPPDVPRLLPLRPDYLGFRGALTRGARGERIDAAQVARLARLIAGTGDGQAAGEPPRPGPQSLDRIFVRDFVLDLDIGAYGHEHGRRQKVRFDIEAKIARIDTRHDDIAEVYSYDVLIDAIRARADAGHTDLVETLALDLCREILSDGRVFEVSVAIAKLELGPGAVGIEVTRRQGEMAS
nr:(5-formylfuran-3-yl)methyl phosphate synthase [Jiella flava]